MNRNLLNGVLMLVLSLALLGGAFYYFFGTKAKKKQVQQIASRVRAGKDGGASGKEAAAPELTPMQEELSNASAKIVAEMRAESRLNLNMLGQLRAYSQMLAQLDTIAQDVDKNMAIIEEITKDEFQENVRLQAALFSGKKADVVAGHLEEFPASRVGAILSKMKDKEASLVLDVWAKGKDPAMSHFYREVTAAYLNNKRFENHPKLFDGATGSKSVAGDS